MSMRRAVTEVARNVPLADLPALFASFPHLDPDDAAEFEKDRETGRTELDAVPIPRPSSR
jgi:hypothetical protein